MISKTINLFRSLNLQYTYISFFSFFTFQFKSFRIFFLPGYISKDAISIDCTYLLFFLDTVYYYCNRPIVKVFNLIKLKIKNCFIQTLLTTCKPCAQSQTCSYLTTNYVYRIIQLEASYIYFTKRK